MTVTGIGTVVSGPGPGGTAVDPVPFLKNRKSRKYMGLQDELAVTAAGRALESAGLTRPLGDRTGLYLVVGYIPFLSSDIDALVAASARDGKFSMEAFSTTGPAVVNPLLTFRVLPNMPAYHVSANFDLTGPYSVSYPGPAQVYLALAEALEALETRRVDVALVGGVAHQRNFLVAHHFRRIAWPVPEERLTDAAGILVLEREADARARGAPDRARLLGSEISYRPHDPFRAPPEPSESFVLAGRALDAPGEVGAGSLPVMLGAALSAGGGEFAHELKTRDGFHATSHWRLP